MLEGLKKLYAWHSGRQIQVTDLTDELLIFYEMSIKFGGMFYGMTKF